MLNEEGKLPGIKPALMADAVATTAGAVLGTSTVTTFVESSSGVAAGGRTGLTAVTVAVLFLVSIVAAPFVGMVPAAATGPVLVVIGVMMAGAFADINWTDFAEAVPAFFAASFMAFFYNISYGIGFAFISYALIKMVTGKTKDIHPILLTAAALFLLNFIFMAL